MPSGKENIRAIFSARHLYQIQKMLKRLVEKNRISERYARSLYSRYLSTKFDYVPDDRIYNLGDAIGGIKKEMREELGMKRIGLVLAAVGLREADRGRQLAETARDEARIEADKALAAAEQAVAVGEDPHGVGDQAPRPRPGPCSRTPEPSTRPAAWWVADRSR